MGAWRVTVARLEFSPGVPTLVSAGQCPCSCILLAGTPSTGVFFGPLPATPDLARSPPPVPRMKKPTSFFPFAAHCALQTDSNREMFGLLGAVTLLVQWSGSLLQKTVEGVSVFSK